jgi:hypothetical protein
MQATDAYKLQQNTASTVGVHHYQPRVLQPYNSSRIDDTLQSAES